MTRSLLEDTGLGVLLADVSFWNLCPERDVAGLAEKVTDSWHDRFGRSKDGSESVPVTKSC